MEHVLIQTDDIYTCQICQRTFSAPKEADACMGTRCYPFGQWGGLMTANQLGIMGYRSDRRHLPPPAGYYWRKASKHPRRPAGPVFLYDPVQAHPRKAVTKTRVTKGVNQIAWPLKLLYVLDDLVDLKTDDNTTMEWVEGAQERVNRALAVVLQTASRLAFGEFDEALTGPCITLTFPPVLIRRRYERITFDEEVIVYRLMLDYLPQGVEI